MFGEKGNLAGLRPTFGLAADDLAQKEQSPDVKWPDDIMRMPRLIPYRRQLPGARLLQAPVVASGAARAQRLRRHRQLWPNFDVVVGNQVTAVYSRRGEGASRQGHGATGER